MNTKGMIEITGVDLVKFIKKVYDLSVPQGMGYLHFKEGPLSDDEAQALIDRKEYGGHIKVSLDYVRGRACKMTVFKDGDRLWIPSRWFDHQDFHLNDLLEHCGIKRPEQASA